MARRMKNSGVEWIGEIPENWEVGKLKWNIIEINEKNNPIKMTNILSLTKDKGVLPYDEKGNQGNKSKDDLSQYKLAYKNTIVANSMNIIIGSVGISKYDGCVSPVYYVFKNKDNSDLRFLNYLLTTKEFQKQLRRYANGILEIRLRISSENLMNQKIPVPFVNVQQKIADFLDEKVGEIDSVIVTSKQTIEDYKKYKQAIITDAVTKGLNPDVEMKESNIDWINHIPKNWQCLKIKNVAELNPPTNTSMITEKTEVTFTPMDKIKNGFYIKNIEIFGKCNSSYNIYQENDIVIAKVTPCFENGNIAIMKYLCNGIGYGSSELFVIRTNSFVNTKYLFYYLQNNFFKNLAQSTMTGAGGLKRVSGEFIRNHFMPFPLLYEQKQIVVYLDEKCSEIDKLIAEKEKLIVDLEKYKKSLIYEYVTGKKEMPKATIISFPATVNCKDKRFAQAVLLTKILDEFGNYHSGRVKVAKTLYVIENHIGFDFNTDIIRQVAGPLDNKYYKAESIVRHNGWFNVLSKDGTMRYFADKNKDKYLKYYDKYFKVYDVEIQRIIDIFKNLNMNEAELLATAYASWNDFIIKGNSFTQDDIVEDIFSWDDSKKRFSKEQWIETLNDLKKKELTPIGHGKITILERN